MKFSKETIKQLKEKATKSTCLRTGKASWWINLKRADFVVTKGGFRGPSIDIADSSIKKTRKELLNCIQSFFTEEDIIEMM